MGAGCEAPCRKATLCSFKVTKKILIFCEVFENCAFLCRYLVDNKLMLVHAFNQKLVCIYGKQRHLLYKYEYFIIIMQTLIRFSKKLKKHCLCKP